MESANLTRAETAERSRAVSVRSYHVELDLRGAPDAGNPGFTTTTTVEFSATADATWLDFLGPAVESVVLNGAAVPVRYDGARIGLSGLRAHNVVTVVATASYSRSGEGLHRYLDPADGRTYLYTQYEPADARRVFACFEQPDMKAPFTFVVSAPAGWQVLSNQHVAERESLGDAQTVKFAPTLPISTYITAVVAGPYHRAESSWGRDELAVPLAVLCRASLAQYLDADAVFAVTRQGMDFYADHFGYPYPFGKYDQVFVPEYNLGAMENPGCVTFTEAYVFRGAATTAQYQARANTILHEMAHMWFGDLVTMTWWDDLWLKESFADYMGALVSAEATEFTDSWVAFANRRKAWAYLQDQLPTTHPIVADIGDLEAAKLNFDGITYAKGASVLKQLVAFVGRDAFFEGARRYFRRHAFGNTTLADLLAELSATSGRDLSGWARAWLQTSGVSTLTLEDAGEGRSAIVQRPARPHRLAVGHYDFDEHGDLVCRRRVEVDLEAERTPIECAPAPLILLNDADLTYAKVRLDPRSLETVEHSLDRVADPLARGLIWSALWNATRDGELSAARYLAAVRRFAVSESNPALLTALTANASYAIEHYLPMTSRPEQRRLWLEAAWTATFTAEPGSDGQLAWARAVATAATVDDTRAAELRAMLDGTGKAPQGLRSDPDLRWQLWTALAATGHAEPADLDGELARDDTGSGRTARLRALAARPLAAVKEQAWTAILTDTALSNEHLDATIAGFRAGAHRELIAPFDDDYFAAIRTVWSERSIEMARRIVVGLFPAGDTLEPSDRWLDAHADAPAALRRLVVEQRDHLARDLRAQALG
ncbi:aminopeptidase N [Rhodococcus ruber]|uniref:Aminopeptidase N n=1 Tax=Rhodococcus ruber TaxID=1830 RepID=A0A098BQT1_9NOCA|nr:aminopeptidase N [Rhodococcus ruber]MCD2127147.1 aminopeptidase N [Rhodococcus ruber]MCZ4503255.1 aminopeptidase N [Rhodococcus ruber]MCZ4530650.1 aminopeptidase N [Rhodococcus ruber]MCZ4621650.1 aminopeptidase N [Rhodococcus ruber]MDI9967830.1 aminopeptidase N [Rhodococcus ruber]